MNRLRECREKAGLTQKQVAITLKLAGPSVSNWESGKTKPSRENIQKLADLYNVSVEYTTTNLPATNRHEQQWFYRDSSFFRGGLWHAVAGCIGSIWVKKPASV